MSVEKLGVLEAAFDSAAASIEITCVSCGFPDPEATGFLLLGSEERLTLCELCGGHVDWRCRSVERRVPWGKSTMIVIEEPDAEKLAIIRTSGAHWCPLPAPEL